MADLKYKGAKKDDGQPGGPGSGKWAGSTSGGSGSNDAKEMKRYMQGYLRVIAGLYQGRMSFTELQQKLANKAYTIRMAPSDFALLLRRSDPMYVRSKFYQDRIQSAKDLYQSFRPGRPVPHEFLKNYAHSELELAGLQEKMERSGWFKREFSGWTAAQKVGSAAGNTPASYLNYKDMWNRAMRLAAGREATPLEHKTMFSANMGADEPYKNMLEMLGGQESLRWSTGLPMNVQDLVKGALATKYGPGGLSAVRGARATQGAYMTSKNRGFDIGVDEVTNDLVSSRI